MRYKFHKSEREIMNAGLDKMHERQIINTFGLHCLASYVNTTDPNGQGEESSSRSKAEMRQAINDEARRRGLIFGPDADVIDTFEGFKAELESALGCPLGVPNWTKKALDRINFFDKQRGEFCVLKEKLEIALEEVRGG